VISVTFISSSWKFFRVDLKISKSGSETNFGVIILENGLMMMMIP
jgi:hypothetical protein